jgi:RNA-directed DNA polymerase
VTDAQNKMVVAYLEGDLKKMFKIQYKLLFSFEARALAVRSVVTNEGRKTPGIDGIT